jgi:O-antigen/teichoic acid export membrane protein
LVVEKRFGLFCSGCGIALFGGLIAGSFCALATFGLHPAGLRGADYYREVLRRLFQDSASALFTLFWMGLIFFGVYLMGRSILGRDRSAD